MYFGSGRLLVVKMGEASMQLSAERIKQFHVTFHEKYYTADQNYEQIFQLMLELEGYLAKCNFNPAILSDSSNERITICTQLRDCFEIGAKIALRLHHSSNFETWVNIVLFIYANYTGVLSESIETERMFALYLLKLISINNYLEYYCVLEKVPSKMIESGSLLYVPINIHKSLVALDFRPLYHILSEMKNDVDFGHFVTPILFITRIRHITTIERAYSNVSIDDVTRMLRFENNEVAHAFVIAQTVWTIGVDNKFDFKSKAPIKAKSVKYVIDSDLPKRACLHFNKPYELCAGCFENLKDVTGCATVDIPIFIPRDYPLPVVKAVQDYGNFIILFDSLL